MALALVNTNTIDIWIALHCQQFLIRDFLFILFFNERGCPDWFLIDFWDVVTLAEIELGIGDPTNNIILFGEQLIGISEAFSLLSSNLFLQILYKIIHHLLLLPNIFFPDLNVEDLPLIFFIPPKILYTLLPSFPQRLIHLHLCQQNLPHGL